MLHQIGIGTLGPVFRTYEPTRDRLIAVKVFRLDIVPEQAQALADALSGATRASLFHPSIVEPIDAGLEGTLAWRAEEYVAAESLDVAMRHYAPAPLDKALPFITQLAGAIDFARAAGIGHGGLHPRDIFVTPDEARATGFGVVEALEAVGIRAPVRRPYSAPERIAGAEWSTQADVFSLAAITFELLTGRRPAGTGAQIGALPDGEHTAPLHAVLARAMDDDPAQRYGSALAFAGALEAAGRGEPEWSGVDDVNAIAATPLPFPSPFATGTPSFVTEEEDRQPEPVAAPVAAAEIAAPAPTPGEFTVEDELDPMHAALDEMQIDERPVEEETRIPFDDVDASDAVDVLTTATAAPVHVEEERFADDFVEEQQAEAETRSPLESLEEEPAFADAVTPVREAPMFATHEPEPDLDALPPRQRLPMLPFAMVGVLGLLIGFGGGYFVRERAASSEPQSASATPSPTTPGANAPASGAATAEKPGQYSEQKVAPPPATTAAAPPATAATPPQNAPATGTPPVERPGSTGRPATPARPAPAATAGTIVIHSTPSRAGVTINGKWRGRTPLTLDNVSLGPYVVRVVQPGYRVARDEFTLTGTAPSRTVTARLERAGAAAPSPASAPPASTGFTGSLYVDSRPRGATVLVDGKRAGQTPLSLSDVSAGSHVVRIEMDNKKPVTATPRVVAGKTERITVSLEDK